MATTSTPISSPPKRFLFWRVTTFFLIILVLAALGAVAWLYSIARSALPQLDGTVQVPGLAARVKVTRDAHGVPTIDAARLDDLFFAQGYVTAQDRLWQMDAMRRFAAGELSELLGEGFLKHDREQRILGLRVAARKAIEVTSEQDRSRFEAYARGVNAYIDSHRNRLPLEFRILHYSPRTWTPEDSALITVQMVKDLNHYAYKHALAREKILAKLGPELTADLYVNSSWHDRPPTVSRPGLEENGFEEDRFEENRFEENTDDEDLVSGPDSSVAGRTWQSPVSPRPPQGLGFPGSLLASEVDSDPPGVLGSNNWVVSGAHTVTGKALLSNDMHLAHQMPNLWYEAHLRSENFDVAGVTLPGMPYVIVGHNQRIAWGFTNIGPTVTDVYVENFNAQRAYQTPLGWVQPEHRTDVIQMKGGPDVSLDAKMTRKGPLI